MTDDAGQGPSTLDAWSWVARARAAARRAVEPGDPAVAESAPEASDGPETVPG